MKADTSFPPTRFSHHWTEHEIRPADRLLRRRDRRAQNEVFGRVVSASPTPFTDDFEMATRQEPQTLSPATVAQLLLAGEITLKDVAALNRGAPADDVAQSHAISASPTHAADLSVRIFQAKCVAVAWTVVNTVATLIRVVLS